MEAGFECFAVKDLSDLICKTQLGLMAHEAMLITTNECFICKFLLIDIPTPRCLRNNMMMSTLVYLEVRAEDWVRQR